MRREKRINCAGEAEWVFRFPPVRHLPQKAYRKSVGSGYALYIPRAGVVFLRVPSGQKQEAGAAVDRLDRMENQVDLGGLFRWMNLPLLSWLPERRRTEE